MTYDRPEAQIAGTMAKTVETAAVPSLQTAFVLSTYWDSFVAFDAASQRLTHALPEDVLVNLVFAAASGVMRAYMIEDGEFHHFSFGDGRELDVRRIEEGFFAGRLTVSCSGFYGSAEPDGAIKITRSTVNAWEVFDAVPLIAAFGKQTRRMMVKRRELEVTEFPKFPRSRAIPKIIHQTYMTDKLPERLAGNVADLRAKNPEYEYRFWSDRDIHDFIYDTYGYKLLTAYLSINPKYGACRADLFRYLCVYKFGGVYLDIKSNCTHTLSKIIKPDDEYILSQWDIGHHPELSHLPDGEFVNWHVMAGPGHPFLEAVIHRVLRNIKAYHASEHGVGKLGVIRLTGPIAYTLAIHDLLGLHKHRFIDVKAEGLEYNAVGNYTRDFFPHYASLDETIVV